MLLGVLFDVVTGVGVGVLGVLLGVGFDGVTDEAFGDAFGDTFDGLWCDSLAIPFVGLATLPFALSTAPCT